MNPYQLLTPEHNPSGIWVCSQCNHVYSNSAKDIAERCCVCRFCHKPIDDKKSEYSGIHRDCWAKESAIREADQLEKAALVDDYDGWVFTDRGWGNDGFFSSPGAAAEELVDQLEDPTDWPEFMFCCKEDKFAGLDVENMLENLTESMFEDAYEHLIGVEELSSAVEVFNAANKSLTSYSPDRQRKVAVPPMPDELRMELTGDDS